MVAWHKFGRHDVYGNGLARAKLRGWLYPVVAVGGAALAGRLDPERAALARATLAVYVWGSVLHLVPFETPSGYCRALAADFGVITAVYSAHVALWCGPSPALALSAALSALLVGAHLASLAAGRDIQYRREDRRLRVACGAAQTVLLSTVEALRIRDGAVRAAVVACKLGAFGYFTLGGRIDAPTRWRFATVEGWWGVHDNFHVLALGVHALQVVAIGRHLRQEESPVADWFC